MGSADVFKDLHAAEGKFENNTSTVAPQIYITNTGSSDAEMRWKVVSGSGVFTWSMGIDNNQGDSFNIGQGNGIGSSDPIIINSGTENVGIGGASLGTGKLTVNSTTAAFYPPRMTSAQMEAISAVSGAIVFNTTSGAHYVISGAAGVWLPLYAAR